MTTPLILQIQEAALESKSSVTDALRKAKIELWPDLRFDFEANKASIDKFSYSHVTIDQDPAGHQGDVVARIAAWLTQHQPEYGKAPKKKLERIPIR